MFPFSTLPYARSPHSSLTLSSFLTQGLLCNHSFTCPTFFCIFFLGKRFPHAIEPSCCLFLPSQNSSEVAYRSSAPSLEVGGEECSWGKQLLDSIEPCLAEVVIPGERGKARTMRLKKALDCFKDVTNCQFGFLNKTKSKKKTTGDKIIFTFSPSSFLLLLSSQFCRVLSAIAKNLV